MWSAIQPSVELTTDYITNIYILIYLIVVINFWAIYGRMENYHTIHTAMNGAIININFNAAGGSHFIAASTDKCNGLFDMDRKIVLVGKSG